MKKAHRQFIIDAGGCYYTALRQVFVNMADQCEAYMGLIAATRRFDPGGTEYRSILSFP